MTASPLLLAPEEGVAEAEIITFPKGLVGSPPGPRFALRDELDDPCFASCAPWTRRPCPSWSTDPMVHHAGLHGRALLRRSRGSADHPPTPVGLLAIITVRDNPHRITANLLGPLVINREDGLGKQVVLSASDYSLQHPLNPES